VASVELPNQRWDGVHIGCSIPRPMSTHTAGRDRGHRSGGGSALKRDGNDLVDEDTPGHAYFDRVTDLLADESPSDR
jgi:hypothetical protein